MWGQAGQCRGNEAAAGIIPTRVGTSDDELMNELKKRDHPHACGDKSSITALVASSMGSSPRVWGQATERLFCRLLEGSSPRVWGQADITDCLHSHSGIIPTRVGTRPPSAIIVLRVLDHPHACGDKVFLVCLYYTTGGSSPRVWGQASLSPALTLSPRIIPTRVGTSVPSPT